MIVLTLVFGRFFCGWVCPMGSVIDLVGWVKKAGGKRFISLRRVKYFILAVIALFAVFGSQEAWVLDPIVTVARSVSMNLIPTVTLALNSFFFYSVRTFGLYGGFYDFYRGLKTSFLGVKVFYFDNALPIFIFFAALCLVTFIASRFWCRILCPLGAFYAIPARFSLLRRRVDKCVSCGKCESRCRMGAIFGQTKYRKEECVLCMDCVYDCPTNKTYFTMGPAGRGGIKTKDKNDSGQGLSRREFLLLMILPAFIAGAAKKKRKAPVVIRPPAALKEDTFNDTCVRCGNCMKVCVTNGLQPVMFEAGLASVWTPKLVPEIGYCEYNCVLCGNVCPTGAIPRLAVEKKTSVKLGLAEIDQNICIPWAHGKQCIVCEEHCPVPDKAIRVMEKEVNGGKLLLPYVDKELCIGCGICQNKCPVRPLRAITVDPRFAERS
jgi:NAD-dependent dihydropyrimidine dehydrogenase PreA subunit